MPSIRQIIFGGIRPSIEAAMLDPKNGVTAHNTYLRDMSLKGFKTPRVAQVNPELSQIAAIFKTPDGDNCCGKLLVWDHCVSAMPAPNPGDAPDGWDQIILFHADGTAPQRYFRCDDVFYPLVVPQPARMLRLNLLVPSPVLQYAPHTGPDQRAYTYTWVDQLGVESPPAPPSLSVQSYDDETWRLTGFDAPPPNAVAVRIYRSTSFFEDGSKVANPLDSTFQLVAEVNTPIGLTYDDNRPLERMDQGTLLTITNCPPPVMQQVVVTESGYYVGWNGSEIYISEKNEPHNWPDKYRINLPDKIVGMAVFYDTIFVGTTQKPYRFNVVFQAMGDEADCQAVPVPFAQTLPLRARQCLVATDFGAMMTSARGVVMLPVQGPATLDSRNRIEEEKWDAFAPNIAAYVNGKYIANRSPAGRGFIYDVADPSEGEPDLGDLVTVDLGSVTAMHAGNDGLLYYAVGSEVRVWNEGTARMPYTWRSKLYRLPGLIAFAAAKVVGYYGAAVTFNLYCDGRLYCTRTVTNSQPFRLPARGRGISWQFELIGNTHVTEVHIATSMAELTEEGG